MPTITPCGGRSKAPSAWARPNPKSQRPALRRSRLHLPPARRPHRPSQTRGWRPTWCRGRPTMEGKTARGASSPAKPALHMPEPLSTTSAAISSSMANCGESGTMSLRRVGRPPPCPLPAKRAFEPPEGAGARRDWGQRKPGRPRYYHKRQTLVRGGPAARGTKPGLQPLPGRRPRPCPVQKAPADQARGGHTRGSRRRGKEMYACA